MLKDLEIEFPNQVREERSMMTAEGIDRWLKWREEEGLDANHLPPAMFHI